MDSNLKKATPLHFIPKFCPLCGSPLKTRWIPEEQKDRLACPKCSYINYLNPNIVAGVIVEHEGKIILLRRSIEPSKGTWTFPAGFVELGESVQEGGVRETKEEVGIEVQLGNMLGLYSYRDAGVAVIVFLGKVVGGTLGTSREALEVKMFKPEEIPWDSLSFRSTQEALKDWVRLGHGV